MFAGLVALADQGRGPGNALDSNQTLTALYNLPSTDFNEVTQDNGTTGPSYQPETGLGSPVANLLVQNLSSVSRRLRLQRPPTSAETAPRLCRREPGCRQRSRRVERRAVTLRQRGRTEIRLDERTDVHQQHDEQFAVDHGDGHGCQRRQRPDHADLHADLRLYRTRHAHAHRHGHERQPDRYSQREDDGGRLERHDPNRSQLIRRGPAHAAAAQWRSHGSRR